MRGLAVAGVAAFVAAGCGPPRAPAFPRAAPSLDGGWRTLRAEHLVTVDAATKTGREKRTLRGIIAVGRPDRFRLRALGPGGIALFDVLYLAGEVRVLHALRDATEGLLGRIVASMAGDLAAAFDLAPASPERHARTDGATIVIEEPTRTVRLEDFRTVAGKSIPQRISVDNRALDYRVTVEVRELTVDEPLDPELFRAP